MEATLLTVGLACLMAAIVGGGLKAFGVEIPALASGWRQIALGALGILLASYGMLLARPPAALPGKPTVDASAVLTRGTWTLIRAIDDGGKDWSNSTLKFTSQEEVSDGFRVAGYFEWRLDDVLVGREQFDGHYQPSQAQVILEGRSVTQEHGANGAILGPGSYSAKLSPDGRALTDGTWGTVTGVADANVRGRWEATR